MKENNYTVGQHVQCKKTRTDWRIVRIWNCDKSFLLKPLYSEIEVPSDDMNLYFTDKLKLYNSLGHMIMKDDVDFLLNLANKLKNVPMIDGIEQDYIDRLISIASNNGQ
jgi:hypothetical protein